MKNAIAASLPLLFLFTAAGRMEKTPENVLVLTEWQDANGRQASKSHALNRFAPIRGMVSDEFRIFEGDSYDLGKESGHLGRYDVIVLWDFPRALEKAGGAPEEGRREILGDGLQKQIVEFVEGGGGLVLEGGAKTVFGGRSQLSGGPPPFGAVFFEGFKDSPLDAILPAALTPRGGLTPRDGAVEIPGIGDLADAAQKPIAFGWEKGRGRVVVVAWEERDKAGKAVPDRIGADGGLRRMGEAWEGEPAVWDRVLRWAARLPAGQPATEAGLTARYREAVRPSASLPPVEWVGAEYPYMIWVMNMTDPLTFKYFRDLGFNRLSMHTGDWVESKGIPGLRSAAANGLWYYPNIDAILFDKLTAHYFQRKGWKNGNPPEERWDVDPELWNGKFQDGSSAIRYNYWASPFSPTVVEFSKADLQGTVGKYLELADKKDLPYLKGWLLDDEQTWYLPTGYGYAGGKPGLIADYSRFANEYFKKKTGMEAPLPVYREPGYVAPAGDPWLKWVEEVRIKGFVPYCRAMGEAIREKHPGATVGYFAGGYWGESDLIIDEFYHQMWKEDILKTMSTTDMGFARRDDLRGEKTQYWAEIFCTKSPGCFGGNKGSAIDPEQLRLTAGLAFGRGLRGLIIWETPYLWEMQQPGHDRLEGEVGAIGSFLKKYGPMLLALRREIPPVWYLGGWLHPNTFDHYRWLTPEIGKSPDPFFPWRSFQIDDIAFPALVRAQVPVAAVTERQLMSDELFQRKAVVLPSLIYCRQEVLDNLAKFIAGGGVVFTDESSAVKVPGATVLPCRFDGWYEDVRAGKRLTGRPVNNTSSDDVSNARREARIRDLIPILEKEVAAKVPADISVRHNESDFWDGFASSMVNGEARYIFVYNNDLKFGRVMDVGLKFAPGTLYDLLAGREVSVTEKSGTYSFKSQLDAGGWKIYLSVPKPLGGLSLESCKVADGRLTAKIQLVDGDGHPFKAAIPLAITISGSDRSETLYRTTDAGVAEVDIPLGDYFGKIGKVSFTEMLTGRSVPADKL